MRTLLCLLFVMFSVGCSDGGDDSGGEQGSLGGLDLTVQSFEVQSGAAGLATFAVDIAPGVNSFQLVLHAADARLNIHSVKGPTGRELVASTSPSTLTGAVTPQLSPLTFTAPLLGAPLAPGAYQVSVRTTASNGSAAPGVRMIADLITKRDADQSVGTLRVNMILTGPVADSQDLRDGLESAVGIWKTIYGRANIDLDVRWSTAPGPATLPDPRSANPYYLDLIEGRREGALNIVVSSRVDFAARSEDPYGVSGGYPGAATQTAKSAIALGVLAITGNDGRFDFGGIGATIEHNDEVRLAAEELAQLAGHYLGLSHNVEFTAGGTRATGADLLTDTPSCVTATDCRESTEAAENIMFPYPLQKNRDRDERNESREYFPRDRITAQQAAILRAHPLVE